MFEWTASVMTKDGEKMMANGYVIAPTSDVAVSRAMNYLKHNHPEVDYIEKVDAFSCGSQVVEMDFFIDEDVPF